jgi:hypothetical protein
MATMLQQTATRDPIYWLGRDDAETRHIQQTSMFNPFTEIALRRAVIKAPDLMSAWTTS